MRCDAAGTTATCAGASGGATAAPGGTVGATVTATSGEATAASGTHATLFSQQSGALLSATHALTPAGGCATRLVRHCLGAGSGRERSRVPVAAVCKKQHVADEPRARQKTHPAWRSGRREEETGGGRWGHLAAARVASPPATQPHHPAPQQPQQQQQHPPAPAEEEGPRERPRLTLAPRTGQGAPGEEPTGSTPVSAEAAPVRKKARALSASDSCDACPCVARVPDPQALLATRVLKWSELLHIHLFEGWDAGLSTKSAVVCVTAAQSNPFGDAKPIDAESKLREIEERERKTKVSPSLSRSWFWTSLICLMVACCSHRPLHGLAQVLHQCAHLPFNRSAADGAGCHVN